MGIYTEYLKMNLDAQGLEDERKKQLKQISALRGGRDIFVYASAAEKVKLPIGIIYEDLVGVIDQIDNLSGKEIDIILETPGGFAEIAEDIIKYIRNKYEHIAFIVPGMAKSAGTIMVMGANEILLEPSSSLGPIDAQIQKGGKTLAAEAILEGFNKIKNEVDDTGSLNRAYIPMLQQISPGELQEAQNVLDFSQELVKDWLVKYKFKLWTKDSESGDPVTPEQKEKRAAEIAKELCKHKKWLTHGRSIKMDDLQHMGLEIIDYSQNKQLHDAIRRYYVLMRMTFDKTPVFKIFETPESQVVRYERVATTERAPKITIPTKFQGNTGFASLDLICNNCNTLFKLQANFGKKHPLKSGFLRFPDVNTFTCTNCGTNHDISAIRIQLEKTVGSKMVGF